MHKDLEKYIPKLTQINVFITYRYGANFTKLYEMDNSSLIQTYPEM